MINPNDLKVGQCYFIVGFYDEGFRYPHIRTMFYIGESIFKNKVGKDKWYFQNAELYLKRGIPKKESEAENLGVLALDESALPLVETIDSLIETLNDVKEDKLRFKHKV
jgi:hypothetical protein